MHKNNKYIILLILFISVGFAYLSTNLSLSGLGIFRENTWDIYLNNIKEETYKSSVVSTASIANKTTINFSINLDQPQSTYTMFSDIVNDGSIDAMLDSWTITNNMDTDEAKVFDISLTYGDGTELKKNDLLKAKSKDIIRVRVTYKDTISNSELLTNSGDLTCTLTLNYVQADDDASERIFKNVSVIKNLNTEGTSISTTDYDNELRFIGASPNNYVSFNNQKWRIIGVFDGQLKIIGDSIGNYSWDTSHYDVNNGWGVNQWGPSSYENGSSYSGSDLMKLLNPGYEENTDLLCNSTISTDANEKRICGDGTDSNYRTGKVNNSLYWNASSGVCYNDGNYGFINCDFSTSGLSDETSKKIIDNHLWNLGSLDTPNEDIWDGRVKADLLYQWDRSISSGKQCTPDNAYCSDKINRTLEWNGKVGLIYPSDWAYATGGGTENRESCLSYNVGPFHNNWANIHLTCYQDNWLTNSRTQWTINPRAIYYKSSSVFGIYGGSSVASDGASYVFVVRPVVYLKANVVLSSLEGNGSYNNPFTLRMS